MSHSHRCTHDTNDLAVCGGGCFCACESPRRVSSSSRTHDPHSFFLRECVLLQPAPLPSGARRRHPQAANIRRRRRSCARTRMFPKESQALDGRSSLVMFALRSYFQRSATATSILSLPFSNNRNCPCATHPSRCLTCKRRMMTCRLGSGCSAPSMTPVFPASST